VEGNYLGLSLTAGFGINGIELPASSLQFRKVNEINTIVSFQTAL